MAINRTNFDAELIQRVRLLRERTYGKRGKARFCKALGISPSTYNYYEQDRVPPVALLVEMARVTGADPNWLLTGDGPEPSDGPQAKPASVPTRADGADMPPEHEQMVARLAAALGSEPAAAKAMGAFLDIVEQHKAIVMPRQAAQSAAMGRSSWWIPVLGRTAAGVPAFWAGGQANDLRQQYDQAVAELGSVAGQQAAVAERLEDAAITPTGVQMIQLATPRAMYGLSVSEFVDLGVEAQRVSGHGGPVQHLFALRVDGDSMSPALAHGDLVVLSPDVAAKDGRTAVVQLADQIGVTCKLIRRDGGRTHLIPVNEHYPPTAHANDDIVWALAVLARVRAS